MAAKTFWQWYDKELPSGDNALNFQAAWDAAIESVEENSNSLQQLKAEISASIDALEEHRYYKNISGIINSMRQKLSAI